MYTLSAKTTKEGNMASNSKKLETFNSNDNTVEVLYQKMGNRWFAFSLIDEEVFVGSITQDEIDEAAMQQASAPNAIHTAQGPEIGNS
jgi:hypothetical protein